MAKKKGVLTDYYQTREDVIDFYHDLSKRLAKLRNKGVAFMTEEDYKLLYAIHDGTLQMPSMQVGLMSPNGYPDKNNFRRGMFNPHVIFGIDRINGKQFTKQDPWSPLSLEATRIDSSLLDGLNLFGKYNNSDPPLRMGGNNYL